MTLDMTSLTDAIGIPTLAGGAVVASAATLVLYGALVLLRRLHAAFADMLLEAARKAADNLRVGNTNLIDTQWLLTVLGKGLSVVHMLLVLLLCYEWLSVVLAQFPWTRSWGEHLNDHLIDTVGSVARAMFGALPGLGVAIVIFLTARLFTGFIGQLFERLSKVQTPVNWLMPETMPTSRRLVSIGVWLFAVAMAYPYLPGAQTEAFKGLSVLLGLMVSLGASSIVGQGAAGLILTYTRTMRPGEYVRVGDHEGTVVDMGMFTTRIRTGLGEELTLPNAMITGNVTKNYSRAVQGPGYVVDTTVTIGYDTPWRQVEALLLEAARRTPGIIETPAPRVFQTALSDFYPAYRLVAQALPSQPQPRAEVLSALHANIQDVFNEYGVQIMSPHYRSDPELPKVVPPAQWHLAPARPPHQDKD